MNHRFWYEQGKRGIVVFLDGKRVGTIIKRDGMYCYRPIGTVYYGDPFATVEECKRSIEY